MPSTVFDSFYFKDRFGSPAMRELWNDRATLQRWLDVEVALARVEAELGLVPKKAAREIAGQARIENLDLKGRDRVSSLEVVGVAFGIFQRHFAFHAQRPVVENGNLGHSMSPFASA